MMTLNKTALLSLAAFAVVTLGASAQNASAILADADRIFELDRVYSRSTMQITRSGRDQALQVMDEFSLESSDGTARALTVFVDPPRVAGTAYLMIGDDLWVRFASTGRVRKMSSSAKKNSAAGSDFSYADMGEGGSSFSAMYSARYDGTERINGEGCHRLILTPRPGEPDTYEQMTVWVTEETHDYRRIRYVDDGAPTKEMDLGDFRPVGGVDYPFRITMRNLTRDSVTVVSTELMEFDSPKVEERFFSTSYLETIR